MKNLTLLFLLEMLQVLQQLHQVQLQQVLLVQVSQKLYNGRKHRRQLAMGSGVALAFTATAASDADLFANAINVHGFTNIVASVDASNRLVIS